MDRAIAVVLHEDVAESTKRNVLQTVFRLLDSIHSRPKEDREHFRRIPRDDPGCALTPGGWALLGAVGFCDDGDVLRYPESKDAVLGVKLRKLTTTLQGVFHDGTCPVLREVVAVGVCGPSGSGKTTLVDRFVQEFDSPFGTISADWWFKPTDERPKCSHGYGRCEESANAVDHLQVADALRYIVDSLRFLPAGGPLPQVRGVMQRRDHLLEPSREGPVYVFVEGFFIFAEPSIVEQCDHLVWLDVDQETCFERASRLRRGHRTATRKDYLHRWQGYMEWRPHMLANCMRARGHVVWLSELANGSVARDVVVKVFTSTGEAQASLTFASSDTVFEARQAIAQSMSISPESLVLLNQFSCMLTDAEVLSEINSNQGVPKDPPVAGSQVLLLVVSSQELPLDALVNSLVGVFSCARRKAAQESRNPMVSVQPSAASRFSGETAFVNRRDDEVFKVVLMNSQDQQQYLVVETEGGRVLVSVSNSGHPAWFAPASRELIPGFLDPAENSGSLVERWAVVPDRGLAITELTDMAFRNPRLAFEKARAWGRESALGSNSGRMSQPPSIGEFRAALTAMDPLDWDDLTDVGRHRDHGELRRVVHNVFPAEMCDALVEWINSNANLSMNDFQGINDDKEFWISARVKTQSEELADLVFRRMAPAVADLIIKVDNVDLAQQHLVIQGIEAQPSAARCPEALQIGEGGVWRPLGFNHILRFAKYYSGGCFRKHIDAMYRGSVYVWTEQGVVLHKDLQVEVLPLAGSRVAEAQLTRWEETGVELDRLLREGIVRKAAVRTLFSCLFYLNDCEGGETNFMSVPARFSDFQKIATPANAPVSPSAAEFLTGVKPRRGSALLFFQPGLVHDGAEVDAGSEKYFLRTDLMFAQDPEP